MTLQQLGLIGIGGALGAVTRAWLAHQWKSPPWDILTINVIGSILIGMVLGWSASGARPEIRILVGTGFCGAFTTFSTFSHETVTLLSKGKFSIAAINIVASVTLCLLGTWIGIHLIHK